jgi:hypothetical protein
MYLKLSSQNYLQIVRIYLIDNLQHVLNSDRKVSNTYIILSAGMSHYVHVSAVE